MVSPKLKFGLSHTERQKKERVSYKLPSLRQSTPHEEATPTPCNRKFKVNEKTTAEAPGKTNKQTKKLPSLVAFTVSLALPRLYETK